VGVRDGDDVWGDTARQPTIAGAVHGVLYMPSVVWDVEGRLASRKGGRIHCEASAE